MTIASTTGALLRADYKGETGDHAGEPVERFFFVDSDILYTKTDGAAFFRCILPFEDDARRSFRVERFDTVPTEAEPGEALEAMAEPCPECGEPVEHPNWSLCGRCTDAERRADDALEREAGF